MNNNIKEIEDKKMRYLRIMIDLTRSVILNSSMNRQKAEEMVESLRQAVLRMFPGKEETWEIVYANRFKIILDEKWRKVPDNSN